MKHQLLLVFHGEPADLVELQNEIFNKSDSINGVQTVKMEIKQIQPSAEERHSDFRRSH